MLDPLVYTIEVPCNQEQAFTIFVRDMGSWWPLKQRSMSLMHGGTPARALEVESREGGRIVEIGPDDTQHHWATITTYDPYGYLAMDFHMGLPPEQSGLVELRFNELGPKRTQVELTHSNWEGYGEMAEMMRGGYGSSWGLIFEECYGAACGG